jgi:hypothetical protein
MFVIAQKSVAAFFLNCTKNTELTDARFARTVTLALTKHFNSSQLRKPAGRSTQPAYATTSTRGSAT